MSHSHITRRRHRRFVAVVCEQLNDYHDWTSVLTVCCWFDCSFSFRWHVTCFELRRSRSRMVVISRSNRTVRCAFVRGDLGQYRQRRVAASAVESSYGRCCLVGGICNRLLLPRSARRKSLTQSVNDWILSSYEFCNKALAADFALFLSFPSTPFGVCNSFPLCTGFVCCWCDCICKTQVVVAW